MEQNKKITEEEVVRLSQQILMLKIIKIMQINLINRKNKVNKEKKIKVKIKLFFRNFLVQKKKMLIRIL